MYKDSVADCIAANFPEYQWKAYRFGQLPYYGYWNKLENQKAAFDDIGKGKLVVLLLLIEELGVKTWTDWYKVDDGEVFDFGVQTLLRKQYNVQGKLTSLTQQGFSLSSTQFYLF